MVVLVTRFQQRCVLYSFQLFLTFYYVNIQVG